MQLPISFYIYSLTGLVIVLALVVVYLVYIYIKILNDYHDLFTRYRELRNKEKVTLNSSEVVDKSISNTLRRAIREVTLKITKNSNNAVKDIRNEFVKDLVNTHQAEEKAIEGQFDDVKKEIESYKKQKQAEIDEKAATRSKEIVTEVVQEFMIEGFNQEEKEAMLLKILDNAKRSNLL